MRKSLTSLALCIGLACAPNLAHAQSDPGAVSSQTSSATTSGGSDAASTNAASTGEFVMSPFQATESGLMTSSEWTGAQLAASATATGWIILIAVVVVAVLVALGVGIYLTLKTKAGDETAFRRFLRMNRVALNQQVVAGHGPVLTDFGELFGVEAAYPAFAGVIQHHQASIRPYLAAGAMEGRGASRLSAFIVTSLLQDENVVAEWLGEGRLSVSLGPL